MTSTTVSAAIIVTVRADVIAENAPESFVNHVIQGLIAECLNKSLEGATRGMVTLHPVSSAVTLLTEKSNEEQLKEEFR